jgi:hypothetical protein
MRVASEEMKMASGQYDASMGKQSNETSGRAIMARQREGDNATFHFLDNVARAIRFTGKILIDLIPKVYDTARVVRILGEDGTDDEARIDPNAPRAVVEQKDPQTGAIQEIYNPSVGRYDVTVAVGPSYGTKRQEAFQSLSEISSRNPQMMQVAGDLIMRAADFPMAEEIADRLKKTLPPGLADEEDGAPQIPPEVMQRMQALGQENQAMQQALQEAAQEIQGNEQKLAAEVEKARISAEASIQVASINADAKKDVEELKGMVSILLQQMQPPPVLAQEVGGDLSQQD